jgi:HK97 gp10 family phage protein
MQITMTIKGARELQLALMALSAEVRRDILVDAMGEAARVLAEGAATRAPRETGRLASSIVAEVFNDKRGASGKVGPTRDVFYGTFHEFGTSRMAARPWLRPTLDEDGDRAIEAFGHRAWDRIDKHAKALRVSSEAGR